MRGGKRIDRVNELLREVVAEEIHDLKDPAVGFVTITGVDTAPDLHSAVVYYTTMGDESQQEESSLALSRAAVHVQTRMGSQVRLKYTPRLEFRVDTSVETGLHMEEVLREVTGHDHE